jgi:hypothetical protein
MIPLRLISKIGESTGAFLKLELEKNTTKSIENTNKKDNRAKANIVPSAEAENVLRKFFMRPK